MLLFVMAHSVGLNNRPKFQVRRPIVVADAVLVVDPLARLQVSPEHPLHDQDVFLNVLALVALAARVVGGK